MTEPSAPKRSSFNAIFVAIVLVLVAALAVEAVMLLRPSWKRGLRRPAEAQRAIAASSNKIETFGDAAAPIKIEFYAPLALEWHQKTIGLLRQYDRDHPGRIHVTLMPMGNSDSDLAIQKRGYTCAVIFINGESEFRLPDGKQVALEKKPNTPDSFYNSGDVITILDQLSRPAGQ